MPKSVAALVFLLAAAPHAWGGESPMQALYGLGAKSVSARLGAAHGLCNNGQPSGSVSAEVSALLSRIQDLGLHDKQGESPAFYAVMADDPNQLQRLLGLGYGVASAQGSLLHAAAFWNASKTARLLLDRGVSPEVRSSGGATPLMIAVSEGGPDVARLLVQRGAHVDTHTLQYALACKNQAMIDFLVRSGAVISPSVRQAAKRLGVRLPANAL
jgi:ankyrin repeat protein